MAERRMFARSIVDSDAFLDMPISARLLYYDLGMAGDDDGFVGSPRKIMRMVGATEDDMKLLIAKQFIIPFDSGIVVIRHWKTHNYIRGDRYKPTQYQDEKVLLAEDTNKNYALRLPVGIPDGNQVSPNCLPSGSIGKVRLGEYREDILSGKSDLAPQEDEKAADQIKAVIDYLNQKTGKAYRAATKATQRHISARFAEGYTVEDCRQVIDDRCRAWGNPPAPGKDDMRLYLRPETLFGSKFEGYLNNISGQKVDADHDPATGIKFAN